MNGGGNRLQHLIPDLPGDFSVIVREDKSSSSGRSRQRLLDLLCGLFWGPARHFDAVQIAENTDFLDTLRFDFGQRFQVGNAYGWTSRRHDIIDNREATPRSQ